MPKSKGRSKKGKGYSIAPQQRKKRTASPRWFGPAVLGVMGLGVVVILLNYVGLMPGGTANAWLWVGLGLIGAGFIGTTFWR